jgi:hypothetical protein
MAPLCAQLQKFPNFLEEIAKNIKCYRKPLKLLKNIGGLRA